MDLLLLSNLVAHASQAAILALGAAAVARLVRRAPAQLTVVLWQAVLTGTAILPFVQPWTPVQFQLVARITASTTVASASPASPQTVLPGVLLPLLGWLIVSGAVARIAWIGLGLWHLRRLVRRSEPVDDLPEPVRTAVRETGTHAVFLRSDLPGPVSFGLRRGIVLLPQHFATLRDDALYLVATHELLHIRRRDALQSLLEEVLVAVFWFYPWTWWIRGRIRLAREQAVDRATARTGTARTTYVETLLRFAGCHPRPLPTTSGMWRARELRARIDALYKEVTMSRSRLIAAAITAGVALVSLAALGAATFPLKTAPLTTPPAPAAPALSTASRLAVPLPPPPHRAASQQDDDVVRVGGDVPPPKKTKHVDPVYPPDARDAGIEGVVIIEAVINREGKVANAAVLKSIPELDQAALDAVLQWEFEPTYIKGKPVSVRMTVTINFKLA